jgi:stearoyl-CoA desaturase (delta-9 desaturase)
VFIAWGNGVAGHKYFAHNSFKVHPWLHWPMALWCTLSGYSNTMYWQVQHKHHHRHSDKSTDIHSPVNGIWNSMFAWTLNRDRIQSVFADEKSHIVYARSLKDPAVRLTTEYFITINLTFMFLLYIIDVNLLYCLAIAFCIEHLRFGIVNTVCHLPGFPGNYRNHDSKDRSQNNILLGFLTLGFGWHNNHHANASKLILTERWWELDPEGYVSYLLSLTSRGNK